jgi:UDP-glucose 4-epimerase
VTLTSGGAALVTGGAGFIGSHVVDALVQRGLRVTVADNLVTGETRNLQPVADRVELRQLDLVHDDVSSLFAGAPFDVVFHLAGNVDIPGSVADPRADLDTNTVATLNVLEAVRRSGTRPRFLYASTAAVYGDPEQAGLRETDPTFPLAPYGASKLAAERYVSLYARLHGLPTACLRLFSCYGPRARRYVVYDLMRKLRANPEELEVHGDGTQVRDLNHVANVVVAFLTVAERGNLEGEVLNAASGEAVTIRDLAAMVSTRMGASPRLVFTGSVKAGQSQRWAADVTRLKALGYVRRLSLAEGLDDTVAWFLREG